MPKNKFQSAEVSSESAQRTEWKQGIQKKNTTLDFGWRNQERNAEEGRFRRPTVIDEVCYQ